MKSARIAAAALLLALAATNAGAHAFLDRASPSVGGSVASAPGEVRLRFTAELEAAFSTIRVLDSGGRQVDKKDKQIDPSDRRVMRVSLPPLPNGTYRVFWRVLSVDTHATEGDYTFEVGK
ncbi:MAG TPA: copper resistance CopC family protein [Burkholderiales bacterium]|nr:copper resistance CopC family protein [Burkholderiales bacterium]